ncbi:MAG TPA: reactive intermediate/imine deaminase, partial [Flavobacteriales bacterium]|nr:reactive intermediate/imine deaminase [Flavobacteriales bacterium]
PAAIGPYSQGMKAGNLLFTAGQIGIIPETGELYQGDIKGETNLVMQHLKAILNEAGMTFGNVIKCSIFLSDLNDFADVNQVYGSYFEAPYPVRETVEVSKLPKGVNVEISLVAMGG